MGVVFEWLGMYSSVGDGFGSNSRSNASTANDELEEVLDDPHCRYLLDHLRGKEEPVPESTLARHVVAEITGTPVDEVSDEVQRRVQTWLHHGQLPVLDEYDIVEFDADAGVVNLGRRDPTA